MRTVYDDEVSDSVVAGEYEYCPLMEELSLKNLKSKEKKDLQRKETETWLRKCKAWKKVKDATNKPDFGKLKKAYEKKYKLYDPTQPPFPGSNVSISSMLSVLAYGEYIEKPYDCEALVELIEMSQRLKSSIAIYARNSVGLGIDYRPTNHREVADFTPEQLQQYKKQGVALVNWYNSRVDQGKAFTQVAYEVMYGKAGIGEGYFEIVDNQAGKIVKISTIRPIYLWEGRNQDRYIWIKNGKRKYFKKFHDKTKRSYETFASESDVKKQANRLLPFREYNLISDVTGVPNWTGSIPQVIGGRYAGERNVHLFLNEGVPKMAVLVAGGAVDEETKNNLKSFFQKGRGRQNAGRVLLLCVSAKNALSPHAKVPTVTLEPLTVGKTEDGSFMKYSEGCDETIREAFRIALTFYGTSGDSNRASSYTLRDQTVSMVFKPEAELMAALCNDTFTHEWAVQEGLRKLNEDGAVVQDDLLVEIYFKTPTTMSEKDSKELHIQELISGALSIDDYRSQIGLEKIDKWWAKMPRTLAVSALQLSEVSPSLVASMVDDTEFEAAVRQDKIEDDLEPVLGKGDVIDSTTKALMLLREGVYELLKAEKPNPKTIKMLDTFYNMVEEKGLKGCSHE